MICADCGLSGQTDDRCSQCGGQTRLHGRYRLLDVLGQRSGGTTYHARDELAGIDVVVKELLLRATQNLKEVELFEREAELLTRLDHPRIPKILDYFELPRGKSIGLYIVQQHFDGRSLERELEHRRMTALEVARVLAEVLEILDYLRTLDPPVVHRDIKPANLLASPDGVRLVDFGAGRWVAESLHGAGSTVTGTFGYMAPEQLVGDAVPASDLFALGATALRLLTGEQPGDLWGDGHRFDWNRSACDPALAGVIDAMTAPNPADRPSELAALTRGLRALATEGKSRALAPYARVALLTSGSSDVDRPSRRAAARTLLKPLLATLTVVTVGLAFFGLSFVTRDFGGFLVSLAVTGVGLYIGVMRLQPQLRRWRLMRSGHSVRGLVQSRSLEQSMFRLTFSFRAGDEQVTTTASVPQDVAITAQPGDEVVVCFDPKDPRRATADLLPTSPARLE